MRKAIQRQTLVPIPIVGNYKGYSLGVSANGYDETNFYISITDGTFHIVREAFFDGPCFYDGTSKQFGARLEVYGTYRCSGSLGFGNWTTSDLALRDGIYMSATIIHEKLSPSKGTFTTRFLGAKK